MVKPLLLKKATADKNRRVNCIRHEEDHGYLTTIGVRLKFLRNKRGLTLRKLEELTGINNSKLAKLEKGQQNFTMLTFKQLCKGFRVNEIQFFAITMSAFEEGKTKNQTPEP
jgi:transcriptional regulator with XRE-family HTH domain